MAKAKVSMCWFRKGLRLHDNPALVDSCKGANLVYPVFVIDPEYADPAKVGVLRYNFLLQSLEDLDRSLRQLGSRLFVAQGRPEDVLPGLWKKWAVTRLCFEADTEPYAKVRDTRIATLAEAAGVDVAPHVSHTLRDVEQYMVKAKQKVPSTYAAFCKLFATLGDVPRCAGPVEGPDMPDAPPADAADAAYNVPSLADMGYPEIAKPQRVLFPGGETEALDRMRRSLKDHAWVCAFEKPKTHPNALAPATTVLSPYLKFGCLSPRLFYHELDRIYKAAKGKHTQPPVSLHGQLLWREFFYLNGHGVANFGRMVGNPICRQIPWDPSDHRLDAWQNARTGFPFIDAIMTQLRNEGWIHHLARHAVACFLTRGDLWQSWEEGARVFDLLLLDADWSLNSANWQWLSCSAFFHQYFRCYSPVAFGKKTDP